MAVDKEAKITIARNTLTKAGIQFASNNGYIHIKITGPNGCYADLWPTTDRWAVQFVDEKLKGFGLDSLMYTIQDWRQ